MQYEVYYFSGEGHILKRMPLECAGDDEAVAAASRFDFDVEVWQRFRLVARIDNKGNILPFRETL